MNMMYGFDGEVKAKYTATLIDLFREVFCLLPLCTVLDDKVFIVHGGLFSKDGVTLDQIEKVKRRLLECGAPAQEIEIKITLFFAFGLDSG